MTRLSDYDGFDMHCAVRIAADDDVGRERFVRDCTRPPFPFDRIEALREGRLAYRVKSPRQGRTHRVMTPIELMGRLASLRAARRTAGHAVAALGVLVVGIALGAFLTAHAERAAATPVPAIAVHEAAPAPLGPRARAAVLSTSSSGHSPIVAPPIPPQHKRRVPERTAPLSATSGEGVWIEAARRAWKDGAYEGALERLAAHEERFPRGDFAAERERLRRGVLAEMARREADAGAEQPARR